MNSLDTHDASVGRSPARILFVVNDAWFLASHRFEIVQAAVKAGYEVHIAGHPDASVADFEAVGAVFHAWKLAPRGVGPIKEWRAVADLWRIVKRTRPAAVHLITIKALVYGGLVARLQRVPAVVFAIAGMGNVFVARTLRETGVRIVASLAYRVSLTHPNLFVIAQNEPDQRRFADGGLVDPDKVIITRGSGVDLHQFPHQPQPQGPVTFLLASRMLGTKGVHEFVEAARRLRRERPDTRFVLAGRIDPDNPHSVLLPTIQSWVDEGVIEWRGQCDDMPALMSEAHVVCLPTYYGEGLPKVLIEASATGRAIIASDWPGCREIALAGVNGVLVPPRDAAALGDAMLALVDDPLRRIRFGDAGRSLAERDFSVDKVVASTLEVYRRAIGSGHSIPIPECST